MKQRKIICTLLGVALCLGLAACGQQTAPIENVQQPVEEEGPAWWFETAETSDKYSDEEGNLLASYDYQTIVMKTSEQADEEQKKTAENFNAGMQEILDNQLQMGGGTGAVGLF